MADKNVISKGNVKDSKSEKMKGATLASNSESINLDGQIEENYQKLVSLMDSMQCMTACNEKVEMYNRLSDFREAMDEFNRIPGYLDANELAMECDQSRIMLEKKSIRKRISILSVSALVLILAIVGATTPGAKYYFAKAAQMAHAYDTAIRSYKSLSDYKDSEERLRECQYQNGLALAKEGNYKGARKAFEAAGTYKDSDQQKVSMEKLIIRNVDLEDIVKVGNTEWRILDIHDDRALLMKRNALPEMPYHDASGNVTWETSSLRNWLNTAYLEETFTEEEQKNIILSDVVNNDNVTYGTDGGSDTKDYLYLLSIEDVNQYQSLFPEFKNNFWLRSPGHSSDSVAFLSVNGQIMDYGYIATSNEMMIRPIFWFKLD